MLQARLHQLGAQQLLHAVFVVFAPGAAFFAWRKPQHRALLVQRARFAVNPAKAQRGCHRLVIGHARFTGGQFVANQPNALAPRMVALQPFSPGQRGRGVDVVGGSFGHG